MYPQRVYDLSPDSSKWRVVAQYTSQSSNWTDAAPIHNKCRTLNKKSNSAFNQFHFDFPFWVNHFRTIHMIHLFPTREDFSRGSWECHQSEALNIYVHDECLVSKVECSKNSHIRQGQLALLCSQHSIKPLSNRQRFFTRTTTVVQSLNSFYLAF